MIVRGQCPNCGGRISDDRLAAGLPCEECLPEYPEQLAELAKEDKLKFLQELCKLLSQRGKLKDNLRRLAEEEKEVKLFEDFFRKALGNPPWSAQITWAKRVLKGRSFTILAPTGVGKSVFGMIMALYLAKEGKKCYIVLPTSLLVKQTAERLNAYMEKTGVNVKVVAYISGKSSKAKNEMIEAIKAGEYDILVSTSAFLSRNFDVIKNQKFDFIFVDDVDAIIKSSKNIDRILILLGLPPEIIEEAYRIVKLLLSAQRLEEVELEELEDARNRLRNALSKLKTGVLVVSTATGRPRGIRVRLFRELLDFEIGARTELLRKVVDSYYIIENEDCVEKKAAEIAARLGKGGLIFVQPGTPEERLEILFKELEKLGVKAEFVTSKSKEVLSAFEKGEVDVLVGYAMYYGLLVRGIDLPHVIRYAIFVGVPHFKFAAGVEDAGPARILQMAQVIRNVVTGDEGRYLDRMVARLRRFLARLDAQTYRLLAEALTSGERPEGFLGYLFDRLVELRKKVAELISREELLKSLEERTLASIRFIEGKPFLFLPDAPTYLQATGRTSRMYAGGISKGLAVVVTDDEKLLKALMKQVGWYTDEVEWIDFEKLDLNKVLAEIDRDREFIRRLLAGEVKVTADSLVKTALVVVESPTKARTIASFFGRPSRRRIGSLSVYEIGVGDYILLIAASKGHVLDLVTDEGFWGVLVENGRRFIPVYSTIKRCLNCGEQFTETEDSKCPYCKSTHVVDQQATVDGLREVANEVGLVLLATDPDTEGEKIAWDLYLLLNPYTREVKRIEFHEVTRRAFEEALRNPRSIDVRRVEAQLVRRIEDRWIGFSLSQKLWEAFGKRWLSAGRVQTPVLGWVIEQFDKAKKSIKTVFRITLENGVVITFECDKLEEPARELAKKLREAEVTIEEVGVEESVSQPPPPLTTDALLREAASRMGIGVDEVMRLAQDLFETGLITYHRTDSVHVSALGISIARAYITERFGKEAFVPRSWGPPGTHECIRPTRPYDAETLRALVSQGILQLVRPLTRYHYRLYDLIFRRFIASQMREATIKIAKYRVSTLYFSKEMSSVVEIVEPGYTAVYTPFQISPLEPGRYKIAEVRHRKMPTERLYTQADLIARMKEAGIGRPSTYAKIVSTLLERRYVIETKRHRLVPTKLGIDVYNFLVSKEEFRNLVSVERTRVVEELMDKIERGEADYVKVLEDFFEEVKRVAQT